MLLFAREIALANGIMPSPGCINNLTGALPFRFGSAGSLTLAQVLLSPVQLTHRSTKPKGNCTYDREKTSVHCPAFSLCAGTFQRRREKYSQKAGNSRHGTGGNVARPRGLEVTGPLLWPRWKGACTARYIHLCEGGPGRDESEICG